MKHRVSDECSIRMGALGTPLRFWVGMQTGSFLIGLQVPQAVLSWFQGGTQIAWGHSKRIAQCYGQRVLFFPPVVAISWNKWECFVALKLSYYIRYLVKDGFCDSQFLMKDSILVIKNMNSGIRIPVSIPGSTTSQMWDFENSNTPQLSFLIFKRGLTIVWASL